jgi:hypothetical protein
MVTSRVPFWPELARRISQISYSSSSEASAPVDRMRRRLAASRWCAGELKPRSARWRRIADLGPPALFSTALIPTSGSTGVMNNLNSSVCRGQTQRGLRTYGRPIFTKKQTCRRKLKQGYDNYRLCDRRNTALEGVDDEGGLSRWLVLRCLNRGDGLCCCLANLRSHLRENTNTLVDFRV